MNKLFTVRICFFSIPFRAFFFCLCSERQSERQSNIQQASRRLAWQRYSWVTTTIWWTFVCVLSHFCCLHGWHFTWVVENGGWQCWCIDLCLTNQQTFMSGSINIQYMPLPCWESSYSEAGAKKKFLLRTMIFSISCSADTIKSGVLRTMLLELRKGSSGLKTLLFLLHRNCSLIKVVIVTF